jgi:paxillin
VTGSSSLSSVVGASASSPQQSHDTACAKCNKAFTATDKKTNALGKKWHQSCFVCAHCNLGLSPDFLHHESKPYCDKCFSAHIKPQIKLAVSKGGVSAITGSSSFSSASDLCGGCGKDLSGVTKKVGALGKKWHQECFACCECHQVLQSNFISKEGKPYCGCKSKELCASCGKAFVEGTRLSALGKKYHTHCFSCTGCKNVLASGLWVNVNNAPYCPNCAKKAK